MSEEVIHSNYEFNLRFFRINHSDLNIYKKSCLIFISVYKEPCIILLNNNNNI